MRPSPRKIRSRRAAFTLVELLVAITIIALLIALLVPALMNVNRNARIAEVKVDIQSLEGGLADFKAHFGEYPPSSITLQPPGNASAWDARSRATIKRFWPQFNFATSGGASWLGSAQTLNGAECLMFFLGGVPENSGGTWIAHGFSKNPTRPFELPASRTSSRLGPFVEFAPSRITDTDNDGFAEYLDPISSQTLPYVYYSSYDGRGYRDADVQSGTPKFYTQNTTATAPGWKSESFQIISPGFDTAYGAGGAYTPDASNPLPGSGRTAEEDNITNFSDGTLGG